jgi:hypothetical protein
MYVQFYVIADSIGCSCILRALPAVLYYLGFAPIHFLLGRSASVLQPRKTQIWKKTCQEKRKSDQDINNLIEFGSLVNSIFILGVIKTTLIFMHLVFWHPHHTSLPYSRSINLKCGALQDKEYHRNGLSNQSESLAHQQTPTNQLFTCYYYISSGRVLFSLVTPATLCISTYGTKREVKL